MGIKFLGIDPGYARLGWGLIEVTGNRAAFVDAGVFETSSKEAEGQRLLKLQTFLQKLFASHTIAHAALETGWGKSMPRGADGQASFNLFGVKAGGSWQGPAVRSQTIEYESGVAGARVEPFRAYASPAASVGDYVELLKGSPRYAAASSKW